MECIICEPVIIFLFVVNIFVSLFHPQFISQFGLSDFPYLSFVVIQFVTHGCKYTPAQTIC